MVINPEMRQSDLESLMVLKQYSQKALGIQKETLKQKSK